jgi:hypothetical protein
MVLAIIEVLDELLTTVNLTWEKDNAISLIRYGSLIHHYRTLSDPDLLSETRLSCTLHKTKSSVEEPSMLLWVRPTCHI